MKSTVLRIALIAVFLAPPAHALIGVNQCGPGTKPPAGIRCGHDQLLLGYRDAAGTCVWACCPPNSDGQTYDCSAEPAPSDFKLDLRSVAPKPWRGVFTPAPSFEKPDQ
ncbi:hypothetical protein KP001_08910 [Geomonas subterranea]|uniref:Secreted protein n=1 Tax=Geomonas subterranea TaxID=2847989 RepID=A0ABX8LL64_9BACT|nr:hypothetical protein [Geomonas subterranea]QXE92617.1 hypothetical protein KP001_08910 [Geomonas subterranea]QXM09284.1 hypothetical protein KP002_20365 [Geomonas subterranea]